MPDVARSDHAAITPRAPGAAPGGASGGRVAPDGLGSSAGVAPAGTDRAALPLLEARLLAVVMVVYGGLIVAASRFDAFSGDELYFIIAGRHLGWGYVDAPPLTALLVHLGEAVLPGSSLAVRWPLALVLPACVLVTALIARELGGGRSAQMLAAATFVVSPQILTFSRWLTNNCVDTTLWAVSCWLLIRWLRLRNDRLLPAMGVATAVAVQNKYWIGTLWLAVAVAMAVLGPRAIFTRPQAWAAAALAGAATIPGLIWQAGHGWFGLQMGVVAQDQAQRAAAYGLGAFGGRLIWLPETLATMGLVGAVLFCVGLWWLVRRGGPLRVLGWAVVLVVLGTWDKGLPTHLVAGMFPLCWAAGAVQVQRGLDLGLLRWVPGWPTIGVSLAVLLAAMVPVRSVTVSQAEQTVLAYHHDDWAGLARRVRAVVDRLPAADRGRTVVLAGDYQRSSALQWLRAAARLPPVVGIMRGSWNFASPPADARDIVYVDAVPSLLARHCGRLRPAGSYVDREPTGPSTRTPISVCQELDVALPPLWRRLWTMSTPPGATS